MSENRENAKFTTLDNHELCEFCGKMVVVYRPRTLHEMRALRALAEYNVAADQMTQKALNQERGY